MRWGVRDEMTDEHMTTVRRNSRNSKDLVANDFVHRLSA